MKRIICFFKGHKPIIKITEDEWGIYGRCCERCGIKYLHPTHFKWKRLIPPSFITQAEWEAFCDEKEAEFRKEHTPQ